MTFTSVDFIVYLPAVFFLFALSPRAHQQAMMLVASYGFYAWWDWRYIPLLLISTYIDFFAAQRNYAAQSRNSKLRWLYLSILVNIGLLGFFKYYNFSVITFDQLLGWQVAIHQLALPIGISFYTFQTLSYSIDVHRGEIKPERNFINFALFVSFFPQLVAGPIERANNLLPQIVSFPERTKEKFRKGLLLIVWGFFIKLVIADNLTAPIRSIFFSGVQFHGLIYAAGSSLFLIKLYADFMAYSEIARGTALLFGVKLGINFRRPFFATSTREFWQRWHISLTSWIGDYVNKPLRERLKDSPLRPFIVILIMTLVGLWHGAGWNFVLYGLVQGIFIFLWNPVARTFTYWIPLPPKLNAAFGWFFMYFSVWLVAPIFLITSYQTYTHAVSNFILWNTVSLAESIALLNGKWDLLIAICGASILAAVSFNDEFTARSFYSRVLATSSVVRWAISFAIVISILLFGKLNSEEFIYYAF